MKHILLASALFFVTLSCATAQYSEQTVGAYGTFVATMQSDYLKDTLGLKSGFGGGVRYRYLTKEANFRFAFGADYNSMSATSTFDTLERTRSVLRIAPAVDFGAFRYNFAPHIGIEFPFSFISQKVARGGAGGTGGVGGGAGEAGGAGYSADTSFMRIGLSLKAGFSIRVGWNIELNVDETYDMVNLITKESGENPLSNLRTVFGFSYYLTHARDNY